MNKCCNNCMHEHKPFTSVPCCRCVGPDHEYWAPKEDRRVLKMACSSTYGYRTLIIPSIKNVIFNPPATIVFWEDNTKTVVKCGEGDIFDPEKGLAMAISKKALGNRGNYFNEIKKWVEPYEKNLGFTSKEMIPFGSAIAKGIKAAEAHFEAIVNSEFSCKVDTDICEDDEDDTLNCYTCKYLDLDVFEYPCRKCYDYDKHEPMESSDE